MKVNYLCYKKRLSAVILFSPGTGTGMSRRVAARCVPFCTINRPRHLTKRVTSCFGGTMTIAAPRTTLSANTQRVRFGMGEPACPASGLLAKQQFNWMLSPQLLSSRLRDNNATKNKLKQVLNTISCRSTEMSSYTYTNIHTYYVTQLLII